MSERSILVIDDSELIRMAARVGLEHAGWRVMLAESGMQGIEIARREAPKAILLDVVMPDLDGPATLAALGADGVTRDIPVIFLTGRPQEAADRDARVAGVIAKPFVPLELPQQVADLLDRP